MKCLWTTALVVGMSCLVGIAQAEEPRRGGEAPRRDRKEARESRGRSVEGVQQFLNRFDRNSDKAIQKDELPARLRSAFDELDRNDDDKLDRGELREHARRMNAAAEQGETAFILIYRAYRDPVSLKDLQDAYRAMRTLDGNDDGKITREEVQKGQQKIRKEHARKVFEEWDRDKDGKIARDEINPALRERFSQIDRNKDDHIDREELEQAYTSQPEERGREEGARRTPRREKP